MRFPTPATPPLPPPSSGQKAQRPFLVPKGSLRPQSSSPLARWHLLSLDAPCVAITWTLFFSWCAGAVLPLVDPAAMFLAVWILYVGDRLLDAKPLFTSAYVPELAERHYFHHEHRQRFVLWMVLAVFPLMALLHASDPSLLHAYVLLGCLLLAWLLLVHLRQGLSGSAHRLPKELAVGLFFPFATCLPTAVRVVHSRVLVAPAVCFGALCMLNTLFVSAWEHPTGRAESHPTAQWGARHLRPLTLAYFSLTALAALSCALLRQPGRVAAEWLPHHMSALFLACSLSAAALAIFSHFRRRLHPTTLRACADAALLTPVPVYLAARLLHV